MTRHAEPGRPVAGSRRRPAPGGARRTTSHGERGRAHAAPSRARCFAVVGCGSIGMRHLRNLAALGCHDLIGVDVREGQRRQAAAIGARTAPDLASALAAGADAVLVATPTALHLEPALEALRAGADLLVEKPLAATCDGIEPLVAEAARQGAIALVACNMRFHPGLARVRELSTAGAIGRTLAGRLEFGSWLPDWRPATDYRTGYAARRADGGGIVLDAIHELDLARWLLGPVEAVSCFAGHLSRLELETEDVAAILLRHAGGALGEVHLDYVQRAYSRSCQLIGEEGTLRWDWASGATRLYRADDEEWHAFPDPPGWQPNEMYAAELAHFLDCLDGLVEPAQTLADGHAALQVAEAALRSAGTGAVVHLGAPLAAPLRAAAPTARAAA